MVDIETIEQLQEMVRAGESDWKQYGDVAATYHDGMVLFNYTQAAQFSRRWNWFEQNARGLILDATTGDIIARPFRKFFNYGEQMPSEDAKIVEVTEKMDGSLGILYWKDGEGWRIATRGSFTSDQARWATDFFNRNWNFPPTYSEYTLLFEIIYPANRVVVNYGDLEDLVLIGARRRFDGHEMSYQELKGVAARYHFVLPKTYDFSDWTQILSAAEALSANEEGWVIRTSDNERYKVKGDAYKLAHRIMTGVTFRRVLEAVMSGDFERMIEGVPDEFLVHVRKWRDIIEQTVASITDDCNRAFSDFGEVTDRKAYALWVQSMIVRDRQSYMFARLDGKDLRPLILKTAFRNRVDIDAPVVEPDL